jgi:hypothetical protein
VEAKAAGVNRGKLEACLRGLQAQHTKLGEQLAAFEALLSEEATPGQVAKRFVSTFANLWGRRHGTAYVVDSWPKHLAIAKRLVVALPPDELAARLARYFADRDKFVVEARHPIGLFATRVNHYGAADGADEEFLVSPPIGCTHRPQCKSDAAHTKRVGQELRS